MMTIRQKIYQYFATSPSLRVLFVFDGLGLLKDDMEKDTTAWEEGYVYHVFTGDWFTTKVMLATEWADKKVVLLFDGKYGEPNRNNQESCRNFPLMSVLEANIVFHEQDEAAFMDQRHIPPAYAGFVRRHISELLRDKFNRILSPFYGTPSFSFDVAYRGIISAYMDSTALMEWHQIIARLIIMCVNAPQKAGSFFKRLTGNNNLAKSDIATCLNDKLLELCGQTFAANTEHKMRAVAESLKYNAITQKLGVDAADPYKALKLGNIAQVQAVANLLNAIRDNERLEAQFEPAFEALGANIREKVIVDIYGADADYAYWSEEMCRLVVARVVENALMSNPAYVIERLSFIQKYIAAGSVLMKKVCFLLVTARYYGTRNGIGSLRLKTPDCYVQRYISEFYLLDQYYRQAVGAFTALGMGEVSSKIEEIKKGLDQNYATIACNLNLEWIRFLEEKGAGLGSVTGIQRQGDFYVNHIKPLHNKVAVIVCDALRYELAEELIRQLQGMKHVASLMPALAMLPSETKYCKPSLLPHKTLRCTGDDLEVDGKVLDNTPSRTAQLQKYNDKGVCIDYRALLNLDARKERRNVFKNQLVYIFHNTLDEMGHNCSAKTFTSACKDTLEELRQLVGYIHDTGNVTDVFIISDHGFLFNDQVFEQKDKQRVEDVCVESKSRYYITTSGKSRQGITKFPLSKVSSMDGDYYVGVPIGTNRLAAPSGGYEFAHGGASLQELVIPVIYSKYKRENEKEKVGVEVLESTLHIVSSRLKVHLVQKEAVDMERMERKIKCGLYRDNVPACTPQELTLDYTDNEPRLRTVELDFLLSTGGDGGILQFKVFDKDDEHNALVSINVINNTLIEQDDF